MVLGRIPYKPWERRLWFNFHITGNILYKHNSYSLKSEEDAIEDLIVRTNDQNVGCFNSLIILNN